MIDLFNVNWVWVGMGENVGGWYVGFGDGIYLSEDGGEIWMNFGFYEI